MCHVVSRRVIRENGYEILSGLVYFNISIVSIAGTATDVAACTYFTKCTAVLVINVSCPLKTALNIVHLKKKGIFHFNSH